MEVAYECVPLQDIRFDKKSLDQIERIKKLSFTPKLIQSLLGGNIFLSIFGGKSAPGPTTGAGYLWTISQTDWQGYTEAMKGVPVVYRRQIEEEAKRLSINYWQDGNHKLSNFWRGISDGCRY